MGVTSFIQVIGIALVVGGVIAIVVCVVRFEFSRHRAVDRIARTLGFAPAATDEENRAIAEAEAAFYQTRGSQEWCIRVAMSRDVGWIRHVLMSVSNPVAEGFVVRRIVVAAFVAGHQYGDVEFSRAAAVLDERWHERSLHTVFAARGDWLLISAGLGNATDRRIETAIEECQRVCERLAMAARERTDADMKHRPVTHEREH